LSVIKTYNMSNLSLDVKDLRGEIWVFIPGYNDDYQVSNKGRIKSLQKNRIQILKKTVSSGKFKVQLYYKSGRFKNELVGRLVCGAFKGDPKENDVVQYLDKNPFNDDAKNVKWQSRRDSILTAAKKENYSQSGTKNGMAKLPPEKVILIRKMRSEGKPCVNIAKDFGVSPQLVGAIVNRKRWKNI
jgi:hypothetical protein